MRDTNLTEEVQNEAFEVQKRLLGRSELGSDLDVATSWEPFGVVGGDFYDLMQLEEGNIGLILGDVSGKGYDAALVMVLALAEIRARLLSWQRLTYVMAQLDKTLRLYSSERSFAEVLIGIYSPRLRRLQFVQGGGIVPVIYRAHRDGFEVFSGATGRPPGFSIERKEDSPYLEHTVELESRDFVVLFTDGVGERIDRDGEAIVRRDVFRSFTAPSILELCRSNRDGTAADLARELKKYLDSLDAARTDDETLIVIKPK